MSDPTNDQTVVAAAERIRDTLVEPIPEAEPEIQAEPEVQAEAPPQPSQHDMAQQQIVAAQQAANQEAAAINSSRAAAMELRNSDPGEYAARLSDLQTRTANLANAYAQIDHAAKQLDSGVVEQATSHIASEQKKLQELIPGWDSDKASKVTAYLREQGYSQQQILSINDSKAVAIIYQAMTGGSQKRPLPKVPKKPGETAPEEELDYAMRKNNIRLGSMDYAVEKIRTLL